MDTAPMPLEALVRHPGGLDDFRVTAPSEIQALLRRLLDTHTLVNLNASDGSVYTTTLWTVDPSRGRISFAADAASPAIAPVLGCEEAVAVAYLESIKLQFEVQGLLLVHGARDSALTCAYPKELFRFQRRGSFRVRPLPRPEPSARVLLPGATPRPLTLRVLDVSLGGCALFLPEDEAPPAPGSLMPGTRLELDGDTRLHVDLRLQHVTAFNPEARGARLGCEMVQPAGETLRTLQRYIDQTQKRRRLIGPG